MNSRTWVAGRNVTSRFVLKQLLLRRIPILAWLPLYSWSKLLQDILAGLTVGLTAIPQGIAYAIVAGLPAQVCMPAGRFHEFLFGNLIKITGVYLVVKEMKVEI